MAQHWYNSNGELVHPATPEAFPSATTILDIRNQPELHAWRLRVGSEEATRRQQESAGRGTAIHLLISEFINGSPITTDNEDYKEGVNGFRNWQEKFQPTELESEVFVRSEEYGYAGTADLICRLDGDLWVVDFKTSRKMAPSYGLQLRAYEQALYELRGEHARMAVLQLTQEVKCGWRFKEYDEPLSVFLAHKTIFDWNLQYDTSSRFDGRYIHA